ncbi:MAG: YdcF family protein [Rhodanobacteraceae bacterium]
MTWMDVVDAFLSPLGIALLLAFLLWRFRGRISPTLRRIAIGFGIACLILATPFGASLLVSMQENRAPRAEACAAPLPTDVVLLAGGVRRLPQDARDYGSLTAPSVRRTIDAVTLLRTLPDARLVITGTGKEESVPESEVMADLARQMGVNADAIRVETSSLTTWENAMRVRALDPALPTRIWLVTSALHMPRALLAFRAAGFEPCSYPSDFLSGPFRARDVLPRGSAIANSEAALHEIVGELVYRMRAVQK